MAEAAPPTRMLIAGYRAVWIMVMFDLPVLTKRQRKAATQFRKGLVKDGFQMLQFSVYARPCPSEENAEVHTSRVRTDLPKDGQVRIMRITDKQFARTLVFLGQKRGTPEQMPPQLTLF